MTKNKIIMVFETIYIKKFDAEKSTWFRNSTRGT